MRTIELKCRCGAEIKLTDRDGTLYIPVDLCLRDLQKGPHQFIIIIDKQANDWLEMHKGCLNVTREKSDRSCEECENYDKSKLEQPCYSCRRTGADFWQPKRPKRKWETPTQKEYESTVPITPPDPHATLGQILGSNAINHEFTTQGLR
jgi:hypothetical protein